MTMIFLSDFAESKGFYLFKHLNSILTYAIACEKLSPFIKQLGHGWPPTTKEANIDHKKTFSYPQKQRVEFRFHVVQGNINLFSSQKKKITIWSIMLESD